MTFVAVQPQGHGIRGRHFFKVPNSYLGILNQQERAPMRPGALPRTFSQLFSAMRMRMEKQ
jgi:hypothetical protein